MYKFKLLLLLLLLLIFFSSCASIVEQNYALDFQGKSTPVMLNEPAEEIKGIESTFTSGKQRTTVTSSSTSSYGSTSTTATATAVATAYINTPFHQQFLPLIMLEPDYIYIKDFSISESYSDYFLGTSTSETTILEINALIAK